MVNDGPEQPKKSWEQLVTAASEETDPEKIAIIAEEIFAALEERERSLSDTPSNNS